MEIPLWLSVLFIIICYKAGDHPQSQRKTVQNIYKSTLKGCSTSSKVYSNVYVIKENYVPCGVCTHSTKITASL